MLLGRKSRERGHPETITIDGSGTPIDCFLLLTNVPHENAGHILAYGNSDTIGRLIISFWRNCAMKDERTAYVLERVARDIISEATKARPPWPGDETAVGNA